MKAITQPRAFETREKILQAAARLFALKGYHDAKLEEVLGTAGVSKGAFFHQFRDREDLGFAVLDWHMEKRRQLLDAIEQEWPLAKQSRSASASLSAAGRDSGNGPPSGELQGGLHHRQHEYGPQRLPRRFSETSGRVFRRDGQGVPPPPAGGGTAGAREAADEYQRVGPVHRHGHRRSDHAGLVRSATSNCSPVNWPI